VSLNAISRASRYRCDECGSVWTVPEQRGRLAIDVWIAKHARRGGGPESRRN
jgi:transposase-like protein